MTELNTPLAIAPDILSPNPALQAPVASPSESATVAQNFSALLTELMGSVEEPAAPAIPQEPAAVEMAAVEPRTPGLVPPMISVEEPETTTEPEATTLILVIPEQVQGTESVEENSPEQHHPGATRHPSSAEEGSLNTNTSPLRLVPEIAEKSQVQAATKPEVEKAWAEVRKFEFTVEHEVPQRPIQALQAPAIPADEAQKQAMITTNPIINLRQERLPPRIVLVQNAGIETRLADRSKQETGMPAIETRTASASHFSDVIRTFDHIEQARPAQAIEIPDIPQLKVVRAVSMEVGDADSQVMIRIQERSGDVSLQLNAGSEPLRQELQSSVESLMNALRHEEVKVTNVEVLRKPLIDRVRRMKETQ